MTKVKTITEKLICTGDKIYTLIESVQNKSLSAVSDVIIQVDPPPGVSYVSANLQQGIYNSSSNQWIVGTMVRGQVLSGEIIWKVDDDCRAPFKFNFKVTTGGTHVCLQNSTNTYCIIIDGLTKCVLDTYRGIKTVNSDTVLTITDHTVLVDASASAVTITLPKPSDTYRVFPENECLDGGKEYNIKVIDLSNSVTIITPEGKIVDFSTIADASSSYEFTLVGQTIKVHSNGQNYFIKTI